MCGVSGINAIFCQMSTGQAGIPAGYVGPADVIPSPLGWWGLRAVSKSYAAPGTNPAAIICDASTLTTCSTVNVLTNGNFDTATAAALPQCATACAVKQLFDQTGGGRHLVAAAAASAPALTFNCIGTLPCMTFNASDVLKATTGYAQTQYSMTAVANITVLPGANQVFIDQDNATGNSANAVYLYTQNVSSTVVASIFSANAVNSGVLSSGVLYGFQGTIDNPNSIEAVYVNGIGASRNVTVNPIVAADFPQMGGSFQGTLQEAGFWAGVNGNTAIVNLDSNERNYWVAPPITGSFFISAAGSNANSGRDTGHPWLDYTNIKKNNFGNPSTINFRGGDTFNGCLTFVAPNSASAGLTLQSYGTGQATLQADATCPVQKGAVITLDGVANSLVSNLTIRCNVGKAQYGVLLTNSGAGITNSMTVDSTDIADCYTTNTGDYGGEVFVQGYPGTGGMNGITVSNSSLHGLNGVGSADDNGISGFGNGENITGIHYFSNRVFNIGGKANGINGTEGNGILVNGISGTTISSNIVEKNVIHDLGGNTNTCGGPAGAWANSSNNVTFQYNEVFNMQPITFSSGCDWDAFDADGNATNILFQYNYSHNNRGPGNLNFCSGTWGPVTWQYNISENDDFGTTDDTAGNFFWQNAGCSAGVVSAFNNTYYNSIRTTTIRPVCYAIQNGTPSGGSFENNICAVATDGFGNNFFANMEGNSPTSWTIKNNAYYALSGGGNFIIKHPSCTSGQCLTLAQWQAVVTGGDSNATQANPTWAGTVGNNTQCGVTTGAQTCPSAYKLGIGSTYKNTGIATQGSTDFFLSGIPTGNGTGYPIGASN